MKLISAKKRNKIDENIANATSELQNTINLLTQIIEGQSGPFTASHLLLARSGVIKAKMLLKEAGKEI